MILASRELRRHWPRRLTLALCLLAAPAFAQAAPAPDPGAPLPYVIGLHEAYLTPQYWAARLDNADAPILDRSQIEAQNARMRAQDSHIQDIAALPAQLDAATVHASIAALSSWPSRTLYNDKGQAITPALRSTIEANLGLDAIPARTAPQYGLVVKRAALRTFPTRERVFSSVGDTDIDRFQESALFPGDKVAVVHRSADGRWLFVHSERYGWGHDYDTRDCSGFVSEIYRSFGVLLPRNTSAQAVSPALDRLPFTGKDGKALRDRAVSDLQVGDLVYIPGHVMMAIGHVDGRTWVIHDTAGGSWFGADGKRVQAHLNGVSVTPLEPMMASDTVRYIDRITNIQRLRAKTP